MPLSDGTYFEGLLETYFHRYCNSVVTAKGWNVTRGYYQDGSTTLQLAKNRLACGVCSSAEQAIWGDKAYLRITYDGKAHLMYTRASSSVVEWDAVSPYGWVARITARKVHMNNKRKNRHAKTYPSGRYPEQCVLPKTLKQHQCNVAIPKRHQRAFRKV